MTPQSSLYHQSSLSHRCRHRFPALLVLAVIVLLTGCKQPPGSTHIDQATVKGTQDIVVSSLAQFSDSNDASQVFYICTFVWTNNGPDQVPRIARFILTDTNQNRYPALESGGVPLVGVNNYHGTVKHGESHEFTVGYHVPFNTVGSIFYDQT